MKKDRCMKKLSFLVHFNSGRRVKRKWAYEKPWALGTISFLVGK
jgi:hypothetical protein